MSSAGLLVFDRSTGETINPKTKLEAIGHTTLHRKWVAHFALEGFEPFLQGSCAAPALLDELQQTLRVPTPFLIDARQHSDIILLGKRGV
jgi:hypothetical protein